MGLVPKHSTFWDRSHVMRDRSRFYGTGTPRTHSLVWTIAEVALLVQALENSFFLVQVMADAALVVWTIAEVTLLVQGI